jgi:capsular polysaccharide biosynthesis protein
MNRLAKWMMRLYPARWRRRYGDELDALLCETGADARVVADLLKGGVRMQFSTWSFAKLAVVLGIAGLLLGAAGSFLIAPIYESNATLEMTSLSSEPARTLLNSLISQTDPEILSRTSLYSIINKPQLELYRNERKVMPLEDVIEQMKNDIRIVLIDQPGSKENSAAFEISFRYPDPAKAQAVTSTLVGKFSGESFQRRLDEVAGKHYLYVIDPASLAVRPVFPSHDMVLLVGCLLGALSPFAWRRLRRKSTSTWGFAIWTLVFGFVGVLGASVAFALWAQGEQNPLGLRYRSTATVFIQNGSGEQIQAIATNATSHIALGTIITNRRLDLYKEERKTQPLEDVIQNMNRNLALTPSGEYLTISFEYPDRYKAQQTVFFLANRMEETYATTYSVLPDEPSQPSPTVLEVIDKASMPALPISPNRYVIAIKGALAGLVLAAVIATIRRRWKPEAELPMDAVNE